METLQYWILNYADARSLQPTFNLPQLADGISSTEFRSRLDKAWEKLQADWMSEVAAAMSLVPAADFLPVCIEMMEVWWEQRQDGSLSVAVPTLRPTGELALLCQPLPSTPLPQSIEPEPTLIAKRRSLSKETAATPLRLPCLADLEISVLRSPSAST